MPDLRLLLVHAHPDDETIGTGAVMAKYVTEGVQVTLVTCTLGEEGEVLVADLQHERALLHGVEGRHVEVPVALAVVVPVAVAIAVAGSLKGARRAALHMRLPRAQVVPERKVARRVAKERRLDLTRDAVRDLDVRGNDALVDPRRRAVDAARAVRALVADRALEIGQVVVRVALLAFFCSL